MPASCENNEVPANSKHSILFASYSHDDINESDQQPAMNASLINIVSLESDLAATRLIVEEHELEIEKLKSDNNALKSALELLKKKPDTNQKAKLKKLMQENDSLKRELSKYNGIRRYTIHSTSDKPANQTQLDKLQDELSVTQAKLSSLQDSVRAYATNLIDLTDANAKSSNTLAAADIQIACGNAKNDDFQVVTRRGRRQHGDVSERHNRQDDGDVGERHNQQAEVQPSGETSVCPVTAPVSVAPSGGQSSEQRRRSPAGPQRKSYAGALRERLPDTVVIGT